MFHKRHQFKFMKLLSIVAAVGFAASVRADLTFYSDNALQPEIQNWSWGAAEGSPNFAATDMVYEGATSLYHASQPNSWGALSLYSTVTFGTTYTALFFAISGDNLGSKINIQLSATSDNGGHTIPLSACINDAVTTATSWTVAMCDLSLIPAHDYNRISFQDVSGSSIAFHLDSIRLGALPPKYPTFTGASAIGSNTIVLFGNGLLSNITAINFVRSSSTKKEVLRYKNAQVISDKAFPRTYIDVYKPFVPGNLTVLTTGGNYTISIGDTQIMARFNSSKSASYPISSDIYGMAFIESAAYAKKYGVTINRWGGNDRSNYNPDIDASNSGNDWYFINKPVSNAQKFISDALSWGKAFYSVAALDWVSKNADTNTASFPASIYPEQEKIWNGVGNGKFPNGTEIPAPADPSAVYVPWNVSKAEAFLRTLNPAPSIFAVDNELDITSSTHRDCHPQKMTYDEMLYDRFLPYAKVIKKVFPKAFVVGPSSCCWNFYWNSDLGASDKAAHNGTDFIPWFLQTLKAMEPKTGRLLDALDIHAYAADGLGSSIGTDEAASYQRMRLSRSYWDPTYLDEGWIGQAGQYVSSQPLPQTTMYIPRFRQLIEKYYPGTKFGIGEYSFGGEQHISGGLVVADTLGVFGREKLDWATYWTFPADGSYAAAAFWLYRGNSTYQFPSFANQLTFDKPLNPDFVGIYAATTKPNGFGRPAVVIVNKHLERSILLNVNNKNKLFDAGTFHVRHFGGIGGAGLGSVEIKINGGVVAVPAQTAILIYKM